MATINISLPDSVRGYVEKRVAEGGFATASEYVHTLIREEQKRRAQERLEELLLQGLDSGDVREMAPEDWDAIRHEVRNRLSRPRS